MTLETRTTWKRVVVGEEPSVITAWVFPITFPPPSTDIPERHIFRLSQHVLIFDDNAFLSCEVLPDSERDMFDMKARQGDLRVQAVEANPGKQIRVHDTEIGSGEEVSLGFGLGNHGTIDIVKVEGHHIFLRKI